LPEDCRTGIVQGVTPGVFNISDVFIVREVNPSSPCVKATLLIKLSCALKSGKKPLPFITFLNSNSIQKTTLPQKLVQSSFLDKATKTTLVFILTLLFWYI
jgi:hypothetical protein